MATNRKFTARFGLDNNANTIDNLGVTGSSLSLSGPNSVLFTSTGTTSLILPTAGTLATVDQLNALGTVNNGTLTMAVSGTGLSGSATFTANQSGNSTFTVTSNATNANTGSTIVARDSGGNFSAGTITANLNGTATQATFVQNTSVTGADIDRGSGIRSLTNSTASTGFPSEFGVSLEVRRAASGSGSPGSFQLFSANANDEVLSFRKVTAQSPDTWSSWRTIVHSGNIATLAPSSITGSAGLNVLKAGDVMTGALTLPVGTTGAPSLSFTGSTSTGLFSPTASTLAISTNATERMRVSVDGNLLVGTVSDRGDRTQIVAAGTGAALRITQTGTGNALTIEDAASPDSTPLVVTADGQMVIGHTSVTAFTRANTLTFLPQLQVLGNLSSESSFALARFGNVAESANLFLAKSRSPSVGTGFTVVSANDALGTITFNGADGVRFREAAYISAESDGTASAGVMPGRLVFATTPTGSAVPVERVRISNAGALGFAGANFGATGQVLTSAGASGPPVWSSVGAGGGSVTSVSVTGLDGVLVSGSPITSSGTITVDLGDITPISVTSGNISATGQFIGSATDTVSGPAFTWSGDTDTGMFHPAANTLAFSTNAVERVRITTDSDALKVVGGMQLGATGSNYVRMFSGGYSEVHNPTGPHRIGSVTFTGNSQNVTLTGQVRLGLGLNLVTADFAIQLRSDTLPTKTYTFSKTVTTQGAIAGDIQLYEDTATGLFVLTYTSSTTGIMTVNWDITVSERGDYKYWTQVATATPQSLTGLTLRAATASTTTPTTTYVTLSATGFLAGDGTTGAPSYSFISDTNTGIYRPAADTLGFVEGGVEVMRMDSSGRVGIGMIPSERLHVAGNIVSTLSQNSATQINVQNTNTGTAAFSRVAVSNASNSLVIDQYGTGYTGAASQSWIYTNSANPLILGTNSSERIRVTATGDVGIGTNSPPARLSVQSSGSATTTITNISQLTGGIRLTGSLAGSAEDGVSYSSGGGGGAALTFIRGASWDTYIKFYTNPGSTGTSGATTERMIINAAGNVGIANSSPDSILHIGTASSGSQSISISNGGSSAGSIDFRCNGAAFSNGWIQYDGSVGALRFASTGTERLRINSSGALGIGGTDFGTSGQVLTSGGSGGAPTWTTVTSSNTASTIVSRDGSGNFSAGQVNVTSLVSTGDVTAFSTSDIRIKTDIQIIPDALSKVLQVTGVTFTRTDAPYEGARQTGVIAQEVQKVLPEAVREQNDGHLGVSYGNMIGLLIEAIKELNNKVEDLHSKLAKYEG